METLIKKTVAEATEGCIALVRAKTLQAISNMAVKIYQAWLTEKATKDKRRENCHCPISNINALEEPSKTVREVEMGIN